MFSIHFLKLAIDLFCDIADYLNAQLAFIHLTGKHFLHESFAEKRKKSKKICRMIAHTNSGLSVSSDELMSSWVYRGKSCPMPLHIPSDKHGV
jgi:hypothetical protein